MKVCTTKLPIPPEADVLIEKSIELAYSLF